MPREAYIRTAMDHAQVVQLNSLECPRPVRIPNLRRGRGMTHEHTTTSSEDDGLGEQGGTLPRRNFSAHNWDQ